MAAQISIENQIHDHLSRKIFTITSDAADAKAETEIPPILSELADLFNKHKSSTHVSFIIQKIWESELIPACLTCLNCDYSKVVGSWSLAADLTKFLHQFLTTARNYTSSQDEEKGISDKLVPELMQNSLLLCRRIQTRYEMIAISVSQQKNTLINAFKSVIETIEKVGVV